MDKNLAGWLGASLALAAAPATLQARSYADLLQPIPNAAAVLEALDTAYAAPVPPAQSEQDLLRLVDHHHHHHHHHRRYYHHHHHHHHHHHRRGFGILLY